jgi:hypothetical protein
MWQQREIEQGRQRQDVLHVTQVSKTPKDWSKLIAIWLKYSQQWHINVIKVLPATAFGFSLYLQGTYSDFLQWMQSTSKSLPNIHWHKITIYANSKQLLEYHLQGAYDGTV